MLLKRIILLLTVAAITATMMVFSAVPAFAQDEFITDPCLISVELCQGAKIEVKEEEDEFKEVLTRSLLAEPLRYPFGTFGTPPY